MGCCTCCCICNVSATAAPTFCRCCREGFHNTGFANNLDACLTDRGWDQAHALGRHMYRQGSAAAAAACGWACHPEEACLLLQNAL